MSGAPVTVGEEDDAWRAARIGKLTASRMADAVAKTQKGWSVSRRKYMIELIAERLTGMPTNQYVNQAMQWGIETEPRARAAYESRRGVVVEPAGFVDHPIIPNCGASPDGYVLDDGLIEIKCPETRTHIAYLIDRQIADEYVIQMNWQMACTGRKYCDFVSFDPRLPLNLSIAITRVHRDAALIKGLETMAIHFLQEMAEAIQKLEDFHLSSEDTLSPGAPSKDIND